MKELLRFCTISLVISLFMINNAFGQWMQNSGPYGASIYAFVLDGPNIYAAGSGGVFVTTDTGKSWTGRSNGLNHNLFFSLCKSGNNLYARTNGAGIYKSTNAGLNWTTANTGLTNLTINSLVASGTNIYAGSQAGGVFKSTNNGTSWTAINSGLTNLTVWSKRCLFLPIGIKW